MFLVEQTAGSIRSDGGHAAPGLWVIPMPRAEIAVDERGEAAPPANMARSDSPFTALGHSSLRSLGDELLTGIKVSVKAPSGEPGLLHEIGDPRLSMPSRRI